MTDLSLPVTLLCGFSRAGKTAVREQLATLTSKRIITIDDAEPVAKILALAADRATDAVVVELPDWADPVSVAESWLDSGLDDSDEPAARIDTIVTVIDATAFLADLGSSDSLADRAIVVPDTDDRTVGEVVIEQIEFCDVLLIQHTDAIDPTDLDVIRHMLAKLNPRAHQIVARHAEVAAEDIVDTGRFDFEAAASAAGWLMALDHNNLSLVRDDAAGAGMFVYRARRPFHPARFFALLHDDTWSRVLRSRGHFWIATRNDMAGTLSQVGHTCRHGPAGYWWVAQPTDEWPDDDAFRAEIAHDWFSSPDADGHETVGDRRQELVLIGRHLDRDAWQRNLDACLLTDAEFGGGPDAWLAFEDPFPEWADDHDHDHGDEHDQHA